MTCSILLVDGDRDLLLRDVLEARRHQPKLADPGKDALIACAEQRYDLLLLDVGLPERSGTDLIPRLKEICPDLEILIVNGKAANGKVSDGNGGQRRRRATNGDQSQPLGLDRLLLIVDEITRRRELEAEREVLLRQLKERNEELERYTYTISHDLKSPLITIGGFLAVIERDLEPAEMKRLKPDFKRIKAAAGHMDQLLDELLELSRIGRMVNPPALESLARHAVDLILRPSHHPDLEVSIAADLPTVYGDRSRLQEAVQNLVDNAVKFMADQPRPRLEIGSEQRGDETFCYVRDNGIGIDSRYHEKIFGLFDQLERASDGTGIGLTLVKKIIELHGGRVWVESDGLGKGSTFYFVLPVKG